MRVTRNDVAAAAGVSPAVVSYVLNDGPRPVSDHARERVLAAIERLGYQRDGLARYLRTGKTASLGLIIPDIELPYFGEITKHLSAAAGALGYHLLIANSDWDLEQEKVQIAGLAERRVDGMILMSVNPDQGFASLGALGIPVVLIDRPTFAVDGADAATQHLIDHGHTRIAMISATGALVGSERRRAGWARALVRAGLEVLPEYVVWGGMSRSAGYEMANALFDLAVPPTAVFVESDATAVGLLRAAQDRGIRVPEDLAVVTSEGTQIGRFAIPSLSTLDQPVDLIARLAVEQVLGEQPAMVRFVDVPDFELVARESCGCQPRL